MKTVLGRRAAVWAPEAQQCSDLTIRDALSPHQHKVALERRHFENGRLGFLDRRDLVGGRSWHLRRAAGAKSQGMRSRVQKSTCWVMEVV